MLFAAFFLMPILGFSPSDFFEVLHDCFVKMEGYLYSGWCWRQYFVELVLFPSHRWIFRFRREGDWGIGWLEVEIHSRMLGNLTP